MITVNLGELRVIMNGLNEILNKELPIKPAYWLGKLAKKVHKEATELEENRMNLVKRHALLDEYGKPMIEGNKYLFSDKEKFDQEFAELLDTEIEIDFNPILLESLGDVKISPLVVMGLDKFLVMEEEGHAASQHQRPAVL